MARPDKIRRRKRRQARRRGSDTAATSRAIGDPVFFASDPGPRVSRIYDGPSREMVDTRTGDRLMLGFSRDIAIKARGTTREFSATLLPISHFRPLVRRLIEQGRINPKNVDETIERLMEITVQLIPTHGTMSRKTILEYGGHFTPLIAVKEKKGQCTDRAAVFTAMARAAGLDARIEGDPEFFKSRPKRVGRHHVWPVVRKPSGEKVIVHPPSIYEGLSEELTALTHEEIDGRVRSGTFSQYKEHTPTKPIEVPSGLRINRPDVFGE